MNDFSFRNKYFKNVGLTKTLNKQILRNILGESPVDLKKLAEYAVTSMVTSDYRSVVWKLLTGITSRFAESQEFVHEQHVMIFEDLFLALKALGLKLSIIQIVCETSKLSATVAESSVNQSSEENGDTKNPDLNQLLLMWLISEARLLSNPEIQLIDPVNQKYILIGHKLQCVFDDHVDLFHICSSIWTILRKNEKTIRECAHSAVDILRRTDEPLRKHLSHIGLFTDPFLEEQCLSLFCEMFPESSVENIIDKIIAGCFEILSFLTATLLRQLKSQLGNSNSVENVKTILFQMRKEQADIILTSTLNDWHKKHSDHT